MTNRDKERQLRPLDRGSSSQIVVVVLLLIVTSFSSSLSSAPSIFVHALHQPDEHRDDPFE